MEAWATTWSPAKHGGGTAQARLSAQAQARPPCTGLCWRLARAGAGEVKAGAMVEKEEAGGGGISEEEAAQYDRQIRLWGLEAQKR